MEVINQKKEHIEFVRIIIGKAVTGKTGMKAPTKSISVKDTDVETIHDKILEMIKNEK